MNQTTTPVRYGYAPIAFFGGRVLKCIGIITPENEAWVGDLVRRGREINCERMASRALLAGEMEVLDGYHGDRIHSDDHSVFED